jgi:pimeloyl-ACP methyl ester carboxylesterase
LSYYQVDSTGRKLAIICQGDGDPTVFLESGGAGLREFSGHPLIDLLSAQTRVCLYNRAGLRPSDPAPNQPREAEDAAADWHALTQAAGLHPPFVLFGRSFGGMLVGFYASQFPDEVASVVIFDSPAPNADMTVDEFPEGVWDYPGNVEHLNVLTGFENRFGNDPVQLKQRIILISPTIGESTPDDRYWLHRSPESKQVIVEGGEEADVLDTQADAIAEQILSLVTAARED